MNEQRQTVATSSPHLVLEPEKRFCVIFRATSSSREDASTLDLLVKRSAKGSSSLISSSCTEDDTDPSFWSNSRAASSGRQESLPNSSET